MSSKEINVHIGEVKIGKKNDTLHALLGSCVGVALLWPERGVYGLAHCLLSEAPKKTFEINGRYVDLAITSLLALMHAHKEDYPLITAVVAGGGNMTLPEGTDPKKLVGSKNSEIAFRCLKERSIRIIYSDTGGAIGRRISVDCCSGTFNVTRIPRNKAA